MIRLSCRHRRSRWSSQFPSWMSSDDFRRDRSTLPGCTSYCLKIKIELTETNCTYCNQSFWRWNMLFNSTMAMRDDLKHCIWYFGFTFREIIESKTVEYFFNFSASKLLGFRQFILQIFVYEWHQYFSLSCPGFKLSLFTSSVKSVIILRQSVNVNRNFSVRIDLTRQTLVTNHTKICVKLFMKDKINFGLGENSSRIIHEAQKPTLRF